MTETLPIEKDKPRVAVHKRGEELALNPDTVYEGREESAEGRCVV